MFWTLCNEEDTNNWKVWSDCGSLTRGSAFTSLSFSFFLFFYGGKGFQGIEPAHRVLIGPPPLFTSQSTSRPGGEPLDGSSLRKHCNKCMNDARQLGSLLQERLPRAGVQSKESRLGKFLKAEFQLFNRCIYPRDRFITGSRHGTQLRATRGSFFFFFTQFGRSFASVR